MLTILGKASSINVRKVLWLCDEIGLAYEREDWGSGFRPTDEPAFRALNPHGLVPVLRDGDTVLWESNTILRYLAAKHARHDLLPADPAERATVEMWMDWQATEFNAAWSYAFQGLVRNNRACQDKAMLAQSIAGWTKQVAVLDQRLQQSRHVARQDFTLADIPVGLSVNRWFMTPIPHRPEFAAVSAYYDRLNDRGSYRRHGRNGLP
jgi:glutathione S-transferase